MPNNHECKCTVNDKSSPLSRTVLSSLFTCTPLSILGNVLRRSAVPSVFSPNMVTRGGGNGNLMGEQRGGGGNVGGGGS